VVGLFGGGKEDPGSILSRKIFQLGEATYAPGRHRLARVHYPSEHQLVIVVNGVEKARASFELT
jgi:hypothetical protein